MYLAYSKILFFYDKRPKFFQITSGKNELTGTKMISQSSMPNFTCQESVMNNEQVPSINHLFSDCKTYFLPCKHLPRYVGKCAVEMTYQNSVEMRQHMGVIISIMAPDRSLLGDLGHLNLQVRVTVSGRAGKGDQDK